MLKIVSFNINGIRSRPHQLEALKSRHDADIIGVQECKVDDEVFPREMIAALDYEPSYFGQKSHYGVALLSKLPPLNSQKGFHSDDDIAQKRLVLGEFEQDGGLRHRQLLRNLVQTFYGIIRHGEPRKR